MVRAQGMMKRASVEDFCPRIPRLLSEATGSCDEEGTPEQVFGSPRQEKTRQFIRHLKILTIRIEGRSFDYAGAVTQIETFGHRHLIDHAVIRRMITITEELGVAVLLDHYQEKTDAGITFEDRRDAHENRLRRHRL